jgi:RimJ/RimL family protein N-acetyltransferase
VTTIRTARLELVTVTTSFVQCLTAGDVGAAGDELGARISRWLASDPSHVIQLHLASQTALVVGLAGIGRMIVVRAGSRPGRAIGSVGLSWPPDDRGRLEVSCRIRPTDRGSGYAAEAVTALLDWATALTGITRFLVAVPMPHEPWERVPLEIGIGRPEALDDPIDELTGLLEAARIALPPTRLR